MCHRGNRKVTDAAAEDAKQAALDLLAEKRAAIVRHGQRLLLHRVMTHDTASIDDVRGQIELPLKVNPKCLGAVPGTLAKAGILQRTGYRPTDRPEAHARPVSVWQLKDRQAAEKWLREHPELQPPPDEKRQRLLPLGDVGGDRWNDQLSIS